MCKDIIGCVLIIINVLFLLVSSALIILGALLQWGGTAIKNVIIPGIAKLVDANNKTISMSNLSELLNQYTSILANAGLILFIIGIILFVICISGSCGVCCRSVKLLIIYLIFVLLILILIIIFIIIFFTMKSKMRSEGANVYAKFLQENYKFNNGTFVTSTGLDPSGIIDIIQAKLHCCGSSNFSDFILNKSYNKSIMAIPFSCCKMKGESFTPVDENCVKTPNSINSYMNNGCYVYLWDNIETYSNYAAYGLIGLAIILFILVIIAGVLQKKYRDDKMKG